VLLFRDAFQIDDYDVFGFTNPQIALKHFIANQQYYDLILTDFRMPEQNGIELLTKMNEIKPSTKALLMSAFEVRDEEIFRQSVKQNIVNGFLQSQ
jgi:response regulator RpfG family c-di-GMP phosphodiesterase